MKKIAKIILQLLIVVIPFVVIIKAIEPATLAERASALPLWIIPLLFVIYFLRQMLQSFRFQYLAKTFSDDISFIKLFLIDLKAKYYSIIVPSSFGYDLARGIILKDKLSAKEILAVSFMFRLTGTLPFFMLALLGLMLIEVERIQNYSGLIYGSAIVLILVSLVVISKRVQHHFFIVARKIHTRVQSRIPDKIESILKSTTIAVLTYSHHQKKVIVGFLLGFSMQLSAIFTASIAMYSITGNGYLLELLLFVPVIEIICMLVPFAPNGYGIREFLLIGFFNYINVGREELALYISLSFIELLVRLLGLGVVVAEKRKHLRKK